MAPSEDTRLGCQGFPHGSVRRQDWDRRGGQAGVGDGTAQTGEALTGEGRKRMDGAVRRWFEAVGIPGRILRQNKRLTR